MEYTLSVYLPEVAMQNVESTSRDELCRKSGVKPPSASESSGPLLVHLLRQLKTAGQASNSGNTDAILSEQKKPVQ
jgi:hypothetical protein